MTEKFQELRQTLKVSTANTAPHLIIQALAGTGKTTTLIEGVRVMLGQESKVIPSKQQKAIWEEMFKSAKTAKTIQFMAFNKPIAVELQARIPEGTWASTIHSLGSRVLNDHFGKLRLNKFRTQDLLTQIIGRDIREIKRFQPEMVKAVEKLVSLCKMNLVGTETADIRGDWYDSKGFDDALLDLARYYGIDLNGHQEEILTYIQEVLSRALKPEVDKSIDFDDMVWLPVALELAIQQYDLLLVDEAQDLNACQQALVKKCGKRLIFCGDVKQAIYGFAGADSQSMKTLYNELTATKVGCQVLPLTVTRRCGKAIVREANKLVPKFRAHKDCCEGSVFFNTFRKYRQEVWVGDMVLCRVNAPLVSECFRFLKKGQKATIQGRDIGKGLINTIKSRKAVSIDDLVSRLHNWYIFAQQKENSLPNPSEARLIALKDRYNCLGYFIEDAITVKEVTAKIETIFTNEKQGGGIKLSSIHKAKGMESRRVYLLLPKEAQIPHPMATSKWQREQEYNLKYVAITRAIEEFIYVR